MLKLFYRCCMEQTLVILTRSAAKGKNPCIFPHRYQRIGKPQSTSEIFPEIFRKVGTF